MLLFTSQEDNCPNMILEAMACGLPVVAFEVGGVPELIEHNKSGLLATPFDLGTLCDYLTTVLRDGELRQSMGRMARAAVTDSFTLDIQARLYGDLYARQIAKRSGTPVLTTIIPDANLESIDLALNTLEQKNETLTKEKSVLTQENAGTPQENAALRQENAALRQENAALRQENAVVHEGYVAFSQAHTILTEEKATLTQEKTALIEETRVLAREKSDLRSELSRLRKWNHYLRRHSLIDFISRNLRSRLRLARKRTVYLHEKRRHLLISSLETKVQGNALPAREAAAYSISRLERYWFRVTHFRLRDVVWLKEVLSARQKSFG